MPKRNPDQEKHYRQGLTAGMIVAASICVSAHGEEVVAQQILGDAGIRSRKDAKAAGADAYDLRVLKPVFNHMER